MWLEMEDAIKKNDKSQAKRIVEDYKSKTCAAATDRTLIIDKSFKAILEMSFSPFQKYILFSSKDNRGFFNNWMHEEAEKEGTSRKKSMSKVK